MNTRFNTSRQINTNFRDCKITYRSPTACLIPVAKTSATVLHCHGTGGTSSSVYRLGEGHSGPGMACSNHMYEPHFVSLSRQHVAVVDTRVYNQ